MRKKTRQTFAACAMPLLLLFVVQGGSCGGGRAAGDKANQAGAARTTNTRPAAGASANAPVGAATPASREANTNGATNGAGEREEGAAMSDGQKRRLTDGVWGGTGIRLEVSGGGAEVEFDCARGRTGELSLDAEGRFSVRGTLANERGGPIRLGEEPKPVPATYAGRVTGETMALRVSTEDGDDLDFTLTRGSQGRLRKCL
jgi:hypothetical protein